jgi:hypothetical protein
MPPPRKNLRRDYVQRHFQYLTAAERRAAIASLPVKEQLGLLDHLSPEEIEKYAQRRLQELPFQRDRAADTCGTSCLDTIVLPPAFLVECFGPSNPLHGSSCPGSWSFVSARGEVFKVYGDRPTDKVEALSPAQFGAIREPMGFGIGGFRDTDLAGFRRWLLEQYREFQRQRPTWPSVTTLLECDPFHRARRLIEERLRDGPGNR